VSDLFVCGAMVWRAVSTKEPVVTRGGAFAFERFSSCPARNFPSFGAQGWARALQSVQEWLVVARAQTPHPVNHHAASSHRELTTTR